MEKWIWLDDRLYPDMQRGRKTFFDTTQATFCVGTFLRNIVLKQKGMLTLKIAADTRYLLKVDDELLARVQGYMGGDYAYTDGGIVCEYDTFQLALTAGVHEIKVDVLACPQMTNELSFGRGGLYAELIVQYDSGETEVYVADKTWTAYPSKAYPSAWNYAPMRRQGVDTPAKVTDAQRTLVQRRSPLPTCLPVRVLSVNGDAEYMVDDKIIVCGNGTLRLDLGKLYCLFADFDVIAEGEGEIKFHFAEVDKTYLQYTEVLNVEKGVASFQPFHYHSARYIDVEYACTQSVTLIPKLKGCFYPMQEGGTFSCSDEGLNKIYEACVASVRLCLKEAHLDSPVHQEPSGTIGDYKIDSLVEYNAFGLYGLTKADIIRTAEHLDKTDGFYFHTSYALIWVDWIREYLLYTGDLETVKLVLPTVKKLIDRYFGYYDEKGLVSNCPNFMFIDWVEIDGHSLHHPPKVLGQGAISCFMYQALISHAELLHSVGDELGMQIALEQASKLKVVINAFLWDEEKGLYIEGLPEEDESICGGFRPYGEGKYYGIYTNTLAVAFGIAENGRAIMERLTTDKSLGQPQFYFNHFYLNALLRVGLFEKYGFEVLDGYRLAVEKCPSGLAEFRIDEDGVNGLCNEMTPNYQYDFSHGWGATPAYHCYCAILGVQPTANGFYDYTVEPCLGPLSWAKGRVPTPNGVIEVAVSKNNGKIVKEVRFIEKENSNANE